MTTPLEERLAAEAEKNAKAADTGAVPPIEWLPPEGHEMTEIELAVFDQLPLAQFSPTKAYAMATGVAASVARMEGERVANSPAFQKSVQAAMKRVADPQHGQFMQYGVLKAFSIMSDPKSSPDQVLRAFREGMKAMNDATPRQHKHTHEAEGTMKDAMQAIVHNMKLMPPERAEMVYEGEFTTVKRIEGQSGDSDS